MGIFVQNDVQSLIERSIEQLGGLDAGFAGQREGLLELRTRLLEGRFHLAVLGQFKRGKSTLLNALLGQALLPTSVIPLTSIPTFIRTGRRLSARVLFEDKKSPVTCSESQSSKLTDFLARYVAETHNPVNQLNVREVEVFHPAEILRNGVVLIDTPGIGSTLKHNTEATLNFLHQCDAAVFLVSADPPITEVEIEFLKQVRLKVPRLFFILNKADYLTEQEKKEILSFIRNVLRDQVGLETDTTIFCVSARLGLQAVESQDADLWVKSGLDRVEAYLIDFLANEKTEALRHAVSLKAADILADAVMQIRLIVASLQMPLEDLERRLNIFMEKLAELKQAKLSELDIFEGDQKRMHEFLESHSDQLRQKSKMYLERVVEDTFSKLEPQQLGEETIENALAESIPGFFEHQMGISTEIFQDNMRQVLAPHRRRLNTLTDSIRQNAAELFDIPYQSAHSGQDLEMARRPYWVSHQWSRSLKRIPRGLLDKLLPSGLRKSQLTKRASEQIKELVTQNVENLRWAVFQNIDKSFIRFRSELENRFEQTAAATQGAVEKALIKRKEQSDKVAGELSRLDAPLTVLAEIQNALESNRSMN